MPKQRTPKADPPAAARAADASSSRHAPASPAVVDEAPRRLSLSQIVAMLLSRSHGDRSSVTLTRNAKGVTQVEVTVRTGDTEELLTAADAERVATEIYDRLRAVYPHPDGPAGSK